jgi:hypothetical protein
VITSNSLNVSFVDDTEIYANALKYKNDKCNISKGYRITDYNDLFHDISGVASLQDGIVIAFSDLGNVFKLEFDNNISLDQQIVEGTLINPAHQGKIDYEECQYIKERDTYVVSREDEHSLEFLHNSSDNELIHFDTLFVPNNFLKNLSFNKGVEAFAYKNENLFLFPEYTIDTTNTQREVCKINLATNNHLSCEILYYYTDPANRITAITEYNNNLYVTEVHFNSNEFFYSVYIKKINLEELETTSNQCYQPDVIAFFEFNQSDAKKYYIGNFEAIYSKMHNGKLNLYLWSDDNHGLYGEVNSLLVIECDV